MITLRATLRLRVADSIRDRNFSGAGISEFFSSAARGIQRTLRVRCCKSVSTARASRGFTRSKSSSFTARCACSIATSVYAPMPASELAMAIRPRRLRPMTFGMRSGGVSPSIEAVVFRRIPVRPAVDGDAFDVAGRIEPAAAQCTAELVADLALERFERRRQKLCTTDLVLLALGQPVLRRRALHAYEDRLVGRAHALVAADVDGVVQAEAREVRARALRRCSTPRRWNARQFFSATLT